MSEELREQFIGDVVRHTEGGIVHCDGHPMMGKVDFGDHDCQDQIEPGEEVIVYYEQDITKGDPDWLQRYQFCANCDEARTISDQGRQEGVNQAVVAGRLEAFEGVVHGEFYEDAVRLTDVELLAHSPAHEES